MCVAITNLMSLGIGINPVETPLCIAQGVIMQFFQMCEVICTTNVAIILLWGLALKKKFTIKFEVFLLLPSFCLAGVLTYLPWTTNDYGPAGVWCWIESAGAWGNRWRFISFYIPLLVITLGQLVIYSVAFYSAYKISGHSFKQTLSCGSSPTQFQIIMRQLLVYPIVFFVVWACPVLDRIQNWMHPNEEIPMLVFMHALTAPLFGFYNSIFYAYDMSLLKAIQAAFQRNHICQCCCGPNILQDDKYVLLLDSRGGTTAVLGTSSVVPPIGASTVTVLVKPDTSI